MVKIENIELGEFPLLLAPMEDVSDPPFRAVCKEGGADLMYTEFISSEGLIRSAAKSRQKLDIFEYERPIGIQIFGSDIESMREATEIATLAGPDLMDINYGCPVKNVACRGAGSALLQDIDKMVKMTEAVVKATHLPVTVKTRLGWDDNTKNIEEVAERLQDVGINALAIHGRTRSQMYKGEADWTLIEKVKNNPRINIPIFGNGDIDTPQKALAVLEYTGADAIMIGRAAQGQPWLFNRIRHFLTHGSDLPSPEWDEIRAIVLEHVAALHQFYGEAKGVRFARKHVAWYLEKYESAKHFRRGFNTLTSAEQQLDALKLYFSNAIA